MRAIVYTERTELKRPVNAVKIGSANPVFATSHERWWVQREDYTCTGWSRP